MNLSGYTTEDLEKANTALYQLAQLYKENDPPLAEILLRLMGELVREMFLKIAGDGDMVRRRKLAEYWEEEMRPDFEGDSSLE